MSRCPTVPSAAKQSSSSPRLLSHYLGSKDVTVPHTPTRTDCVLLVAFLHHDIKSVKSAVAVFNHYKVATH